MHSSEAVPALQGSAMRRLGGRQLAVMQLNWSLTRWLLRETVDGAFAAVLATMALGAQAALPRRDEELALLGRLTGCMVARGEGGLNLGDNDSGSEAPCAGASSAEPLRREAVRPWPIEKRVWDILMAKSMRFRASNPPASFISVTT